MKLHTIRAPAAIALASLVVGCGGSGKVAQTTSTVPRAATAQPITSPQVKGKLTRAKYIVVADGICARMRAIAAGGNQAVDQAIAAHQPAAAAEAIQRFYPNYAQGLVILEGIRPPVADRPRMRHLLTIMEAQTRTLPIYARALRARNNQVLQAVVKVQERLAAQAEEISRPYGFKFCGR